ncbi:MAG: MFS transporter [Acidobacteriaceae bacterium]|nr:MFS transporter [Acidobacteriaceae bacterium]
MPDPAQTATSATAESEAFRAYGPARKWAVVALLCAAFIIAYLDRQNLSFALADRSFTSLFHLDDNQRGLLNSAFFWTYAFLQIPAGWLVDRYGVKKPFAACLAVWSIFSGLTAWCSSFMQLFFMRLLLGVGESVNTPAGMRWIRLNFRQHQHGLVMGLYQASAKVGPVIGSRLIPLLLLSHGWRNMFLVIGFGSLVWLAPWLLLVKDNDRQLEQAVLKRPDIAELHFGQLFNNRVMWGIIIGSFCYNYYNYFCLTWLPAYFTESRHLNLNSSGWFTGFSFAGFAIVSTVAGFWADAIIRRGRDNIATRKLFIIAGFAMAATEVVTAFPTSNTVALFFVIFSLSGLGLATGNYWALTPAIMPGAPAARLAAVQNMAANLPGILAPILTGSLKQATGSYRAAMVANFGFLLLGMASYIFLVRREYAPGTKTS